MTSLHEWFDRAADATGERPTHIVCTPPTTDYPGWDATPVGEPQSFEDFTATPEYDRQFYAGYGVPECAVFCAWSDNWVFFPDQYDGAESICMVPRHPVAHSPIQPGGF